MSILYRLFGMLLYFLYSLVHDYGIAIILFTVVVKLVLLPLNIKSTNSMRETQALTPALQYLQKKYKNNPDKLNRETANLYKIYGVNPMGGCWPLLLQLPIIYGLFGALRNPAEYVFVNGGADAAINQSFLWIPNLSNPDPYYILPILCVILTFLTSKFNESMNPTPDNAQSSQKMMTYMMPLLIGFIAMGFPAGIALYWVAQNVFTFLQQFIMLRKKAPKVTVEEAMKKLEQYEQDQKKEIRVKRKEEAQRRQEMMGMSDNKKKKSSSKKSSVKMTPASKKVVRKTITKIPQRKDD